MLFVFCVDLVLFQAASETLLKIAADPKHLGAVIGFLAVLHTWGQDPPSIQNRNFLALLLQLP